ncbi:aspartyl-phosphate phosphatase Spo0E family protein [Bacillus sp. T33-2]|uniref:aspartyl-phosphate phosphatase Spo0E family protein n=1 Tax=Bacillus sp. T33-2 TaxID=2054168 RepID=UPI000C76F8B4|nr:aspartyl-phosphate phosphatase Spo0E family protein [Bacillus sp. T33-2]PLR95964.1 hypothetical protein CVD19_13175 [Bacillus sp. T33-2]
MINEVIESIREKLYKNTNIQQLSSARTLELSEELNRFLNFQMRVSKSLPADYSHSNVHENAVRNILEVALKEKFDLPDPFSDRLLNGRIWYDMDIVLFLLASISKKYGNDAVEYMGELVPDKCIFPESIQSFNDAIQNLNRIYYMNHKTNVYIGEYLPYMESKNQIQLFCNTAHYPAAYNHGIIKGLSKKFNQSLKLSIASRNHGGEFKIVN